MPWPSRAKILRTTACFPIDRAPLCCDTVPMDLRNPSVFDEIDGARALGALLAGDLPGAVDALERASVRYLVGFFCRVALLTPGVSFRLAWRVARRRCARTEADVRP